MRSLNVFDQSVEFEILPAHHSCCFSPPLLSLSTRVLGLQGYSGSFLGLYFLAISCYWGLFLAAFCLRLALCHYWAGFWLGKIGLQDQVSSILSFPLLRYCFIVGYFVGSGGYAKKNRILVRHAWHPPILFGRPFCASCLTPAFHWHQELTDFVGSGGIIKRIGYLSAPLGALLFFLEGHLSDPLVASLPPSIAGYCRVLPGIARLLAFHLVVLGSSWFRDFF